MKTKMPTIRLWILITTDQAKMRIQVDIKAKLLLKSVITVAKLIILLRNAQMLAKKILVPKNVIIVIEKAIFQETAQMLAIKEATTTTDKVVVVVIIGDQRKAALVSIVEITAIGQRTVQANSQNAITAAIRVTFLRNAKSQKITRVIKSVLTVVVMAILLGSAVMTVLKDQKEVVKVVAKEVVMEIDQEETILTKHAIIVIKRDI